MVNRYPIILCLAFFVLMCQPANAQIAASSGTAATAPPVNALAADVLSGPIRKGDVLRVVVVGGDTLGGEFRVDVDGSILIPGVGQLGLNEKMPVEAARAISKQITRRRLMDGPSVAVYIVGRKTREVTVNGAVTEQGRQVIKDDTLLSEVLETAVPVANADLTRVVINRSGTPLTVDYRKYRNGESPDAQHNPPLEDGDRIYVYSAIPAEGTVRINGEVKDSTRVVMPILRGTTVGQVLQMVGGVTDLADRNNIRIVRNGEPLAVSYNDILRAVPNSDVLLKDGDEILVPRLERRPQYVVTGAVKNARTVSFENSATLLEAIGAAGGPEDGAQQDKVQLRRRDNGSQITTQVYDLKKDEAAATSVKDGDYIFVPYGRRRPPFDLLAVTGLATTIAVLVTQFRN